MAVITTDFGGYTTGALAQGAALSDWNPAYAQAGSWNTYTVAAGGSQAGKIVRKSTAEDAGSTFHELARNGSTATVQKVLAKVRVVEHSVNLFMRLSNTRFNPYYVRFGVTAAGAVFLNQNVNGGGEAAIAAPVSPGLTAAEWMWIEAQALSDHTARVRAWQDGAAKPSIWQVTGTTDVTSGGLCGIFMPSTRYDLDYYSVGTAGDEPASPADGADNPDPPPVNEAPSVPDVTVPVTAVQTGVAEISFVSSDPEDDPIEYEGRFTPSTGGDPQPLFALGTASPFMWDVTGVDNGIASVEVRAFDGELYSDWAERFVNIDNPPPPDPELPPGEPGAFTNPLAGDVVQGVVALACGLATNADTYRFEFWDGSSWEAAGTSGIPSLNFDTTEYPFIRRAEFRVRAENGGEEASRWVYSGAVTVWDGEVVDSPTAFQIHARTGYSVLLGVADYAGLSYVEGRIDVRGGDFSPPKVTVVGMPGIGTSAHVWITGLPRNADLQAQVRCIDTDATEHEWLPAQAFRTLNQNPGLLSAGTAFYAQDEMGRLRGVHGAADTGGFDHVRETGAVEFGIDLPAGAFGLTYPTRACALGRSGMQGNYSQVWEQQRAMVRVRSPGGRVLMGRKLSPTEGAVWSWMQAFVPGVAARMELGGPGGLFFWMEADLRVFLGAYVASLGMVVRTQIGAARLNQVNVLSASHRDPYYIVSPPPPDTACPILTDRVDALCYAALNGKVVQVNTQEERKEFRHDPASDPDFPQNTQCVIGLDAANHNGWWVDFGRGSPRFGDFVTTDPPGTVMHGGFLLHGAAWMMEQSRFLTTADHEALHAEVMYGTVDPVGYIEALNPTFSLSFREYPSPQAPTASAAEI